MFVKYITNNLITNNATKKRGLLALSELRVANCYRLVFIWVLACDSLQAALDVFGLLLSALYFRYWHISFLLLLDLRNQQPCLPFLFLQSRLLRAFFWSANLFQPQTN